MTDAEIIKALECCTYGHKCDICPYDDNGFFCSNKMKTDAIHLIKRQQAEIERLNVELVGMRGACESYKFHFDATTIKTKMLEDELDGMNELMKLAPKYGQEE